MGRYDIEDDWGPWLPDEAYHDGRDSSRGDPWVSGRTRPDERTVAYVVLVEGRVIDTWEEPLLESRWAHDPRVDRATRGAGLWRDRTEPPPDPEPWLGTVGWLEHLVGGDQQLELLTTDPLPDEELLPGDAGGDGDLAARIGRAGELLDDLADAFFEAELRTAFRRGLSAVAIDLLGVSPGLDSRELAAAVCWAVGKANGALAPVGTVTQKAVATRLRLATFPSGRGRTVAQLLGRPQPPWVSRPHRLTDLEPLGRPDLLTSRTRRGIVELRDAAASAAAKAAAGERARAAVRVA